MEFSQIKSFPLDKMQAMFTAHAEYTRLKNELFTAMRKSTIGKANAGEDNIKSAQKWLSFVKDNPDWITKKLKLADFEHTSDAADLLELVEKVEKEDQASSKAIHDIVASDMRYNWTTAESFYDEAAEHDSQIKEKYKDLPSISPQRKSETRIEKDFQKLQAKRKKKEGGESAQAA